MNDALAIEVHATVARTVTFFEDRAEVVRSAQVRIPSGGAALVFSGMTPFIDERSLQVRLIEGEGRVIAARVKRRVHHEETVGREELDSLEAQARAADQKLREAIEARETADRRAEALREMFARWAAGLTGVPRGLRREEDARWQKAYSALADGEKELLAAAAAARQRIAQAEDEVAHAHARLHEAHRRHVRHEALVEVHVDAAAPIDARFEIRYRTPGALWRPEHVAHVTGDAQGSLELLTWAAVWQRTGEDWHDVEVLLSTARPAHHATPPLLDDDRVVSRRKSDESRRRTVVEGREQEILTAAVAGVKSSVEQMPGVDDGGVPLLYSAKARAHLLSDGRPVRLEIGRVTLPARIELVVYPELTKVAHRRATATLTEGGPLLAGPVHVHDRSTAAGRVRTRFVAKGESFELGIGTDDTIRALREVIREDDSTLLGTQKRKRTVRIWLSNLSQEPKRLLVTERVPVSEIEGVSVDTSAARGWDVDPRDGFATCTVELKGDETRKLTLIYELTASSKIVLPDL